MACPSVNAFASYSYVYAWLSMCMSLSVGLPQYVCVCQRTCRRAAYVTLLAFNLSYRYFFLFICVFCQWKWIFFYFSPLSIVVTPAAAAAAFGVPCYSCSCCRHNRQQSEIWKLVYFCIWARMCANVCVCVLGPRANTRSYSRSHTYSHSHSHWHNHILFELLFHFIWFDFSQPFSIQVASEVYYFARHIRFVMVCWLCVQKFLQAEQNVKFKVYLYWLAWAGHLGIVCLLFFRFSVPDWCADISCLSALSAKQMDHLRISVSHL